MTHIPDLTPCNYGHFSRLRPLLAVGWLDPPFDFQRGPVKRTVRDRLETFFNARWDPIVFMGSHVCGFCEQAAGIDSPHAGRGRANLSRGSANIIIPGRHVAYVSPYLILHYIDEHQYCPPPVFTDAVEACPAMRSKAYFLALMAVGGRHSHPLLARQFPRHRVVDLMLRVSDAGHVVHQQADDFVLTHSDGDIRVCQIGARWVVRRKKGSNNTWYPYGAAANEVELARLLSSALGSPIL